jgi:hypothetical protein
MDYTLICQQFSHKDLVFPLPVLTRKNNNLEKFISILSLVLGTTKDILGSL